MNVKKPLTRLPSQGDELYMGSEKVVVLEIEAHGNFASTVLVRDDKGRVHNVPKSKLSKTIGEVIYGHA